MVVVMFKKYKEYLQSKPAFLIPLYALFHLAIAVGIISLFL